MYDDVSCIGTDIQVLLQYFKNVKKVGLVFNKSPQIWKLDQRKFEYDFMI